jgi:hypothetical protein
MTSLRRSLSGWSFPRLWLRNGSILERAALRELSDLPAVITQLQATSFYAPAEIIAAMLDREADPKTSGEP